jgi:tetratricopeptide (TPR) repeat protein
LGIKFYFKIAISLIFLVLGFSNNAQIKNIQSRSIDSSLNIIDTTKDIYLKIGLIGKVSFAYQYIDFDKSGLYTDSLIKLSRKINYKNGLAKGYNFLGLAYHTTGKLDLALKNYLFALYINRAAGIEKETAKNLNNIANVLITIDDFEGAKIYVKEAYIVNNKFNNKLISYLLKSDV